MPAGPSGLSRRRRGARARGLRTLQHQTLAPALRQAIGTAAWLRGLLLGQPGATGTEARWATKDRLHDEAIGAWLRRHARRRVADYPARHAEDEDLTFWVDARLMERARRMAARDGVRVARLIEAALSAYAREHIPRAWIEFRTRVGLQARALYAAREGRRAAPRSVRRGGV